MHANSRPGPRLKQRFEFGALGARGSCWATDWLHTVRGLNELAHTAGAPCAGAPALIPCRSKESRKRKGRQPLKNTENRPPHRPSRDASAACRRVVPLDSLRSSSFHNPPTGNSPKEHTTDEKPDMGMNI